MSFHSSARRTGTVAMILLVIAAVMATPSAWAKDYLVYFGTFTDTTSRGIYVSRLDERTGNLSAPQLVVALANPNFLAISPDDRFLYVAARGSDSVKGGTVDSYAIDHNTGSLKFLDEKPCAGNGPCFVGTDVAGRSLFVANYNSGTAKSFHINHDGTLVDSSVIQDHGKSINAARQSGPHAHCIVGAPGGNFAVACDLGIDKVMIYRVDPANAWLMPNHPPYAAVAPGSGPRHITFSPDGKTACVISEMACTVTVFDWDGSAGTLTPRQTLSLLPPGLYQDTFTAAEIAYRPDGRFVYATVRGGKEPGANTISVLAVDKKTGNLSLVQNVPCGGDFPRGMGIDPSGHWLIIGNQKSGTVTVFKIDHATGTLTYTGQIFDIGSAVDVKFTSAR